MKNAIRQRAAIKHLDRLGSILSPNELAVYGRHIRDQSKRVDDEIRRFKSRVARAQEETEKHKFALRLLADHERAKLTTATFTNYCRSETLPDGKIHVRWPTGDRLGAVTIAVERYLRFTRIRLKQRRAQWKTFRLFDKRVPSVQLAAQVDELAQRAEDIKRRSVAVTGRKTLAVLVMDNRPSLYSQTIEARSYSQSRGSADEGKNGERQDRRSAGKSKALETRAALPDSGDELTAAYAPTVLINPIVLSE